jgi:DNA modification methylase
MSAYQKFLEAKIVSAPMTGFQVADCDLPDILKGHQTAICKWAIQGGCRAIFAAFGLGKSFMQLAILNAIIKHFGGRALIIAPLGVRQEFIRDAEKLALEIKFIRSLAEAAADGIYITNYETVRDGKLDPNAFIAVSLDEASVLRSYGSKTYQTFLAIFKTVRFRFVATATPSPNRYKELIHYAGFLGIMDTGQALTRFFQRDSEKANNLTLYPHKEKEFWLWVSSWAIFLQKPSDLGYTDDGYDLPPINVTWHEVKTDLAGAGYDRDGQGVLIKDSIMGLANEAKERRETLPARIAKMKEIIGADPESHMIIWHDLEAERAAIEKALPKSVSVYGTQDLEKREQAIIDFSDGKFQYLGAKPVIAGSGCNFQRHCHKAIFIGIGHKFNDFIQAIFRIQRFMQKHPVEIEIIYAESEREVRRDLETKWTRHNEMVEKMSEIIREYGLNQAAMASALTRSIGVKRTEARGESWHVANNDCIEEVKTIEDNSIDLIVTSIPFSNHYEYTPSYNDFGHTDSDDHFFGQMDFLTPELLRILKPGRLACIHVKDRILFGSVTGFGTPTVNPFHAKTLFHYQAHGFAFMGMITVVTDVVRENNGTYRLGYTEMRKDSSKMGVGSPEYVLLMRKLPTDRSKAYADDRVTKAMDDYSLARWQIDAHAFWRSNGIGLLSADELAALPPSVLATEFTKQSLGKPYDYDEHVEIAEALLERHALPSTFMAVAPGSPDPDVWHDVVRMKTLNSEQSNAGYEKHVCPFQIDIVERLIRRYSNKAELVFDPFGGLFTVPHQAITLGRRGRAVELNANYYRDGIRHLEKKERELSVPDLFARDAAE